MRIDLNVGSSELCELGSGHVWLSRRRGRSIGGTLNGDMYTCSNCRSSVDVYG